MKRQNVTIYSLADELGISAATVSRALNNSSRISEKRRMQVMDLAEKRGFKLRAFAPRITNICLLLIGEKGQHDIVSDYSAEVLNGASRYCRQNEIELSLFSASCDKLNNMNVVKELFRRSADGVILLNSNQKCTFIEQFEKEKVPYCCLLSENPAFPDNTLTVDNVYLAERAVEYLHQLGHRMIAYLHSSPNNSGQQDRLKGYRNALTRSGLPIKEEHIPSPTPYESFSGLEMGFHAATKLLETNPEVTAIFAASSELADGMHLACNRKGLSIPKDISLLVCDNPARSEYSCPPLSVVDIANDRFGAAAAAWVHQKLQGQKTHVPSEPWMKANLIIRESTAPPRSE
tara:strand:- start:18776 stop:19816 length:1041 start_codon:yes stop_codon:yes gene_type:complete